MPTQKPKLSTHKPLTNKRIVLGVSGSIAAYKSPDIVRRLQDLGAEVRVILTSGGAKFITELALQVSSKNPVHRDLWDADAELSMGHIELAKWADAIVIAPASANTLANLNAGKAGDLLTTVVLASEAQVLIAPAMNQQMYGSVAVQHNLRQLQARNIKLIQPEYGAQACGDIGAGRLANSHIIAAQTARCFHTSALTGKKVLITLGATIEPIDPVRYLSNHSSGKMGMALALTCVELGAQVTLVCGKISIPMIDKVHAIIALSAQEMHRAVMENIAAQDIFIACAAVSDYRVKHIAKNKLKKNGKNLQLELVQNPDILQAVCQLAQKPLCIGFAAESENCLKNAQNKLKNKGCDALILNDISRPDLGFNSAQNSVVFLSKNDQISLAKNSKQKIAKSLLKIVLEKFF